MLRYCSRNLIISLSIITLSFLLLLLNPKAVFSAPKKELETKATFILNFTIFVEWPSSVSDGSNDITTLNICVFDNTPLVKELSLQKEKYNSSKKVSIIAVDNTDKISNCHILFIGQANAADISTMLAQIENKPVLTISDHKSFNKNCGIIQFVIKDDTVRFKINNEAAKKAGLTISSQLLELADE
ncbi:MAG: YfiR family protein [Nitrospirae bacterium]|nr:YfiR family protein [Nitrospirota bacterium]